MLTSALATDVPAPAESPSTSAYTSTRARRVRGGTAAAAALTAAAGAGGKMVEPTPPQPILRAPSKRRVLRVASAEQELLLLPSFQSPPASCAPSLPATPAGKEGAMADMVVSGSSSEEGNAASSLLAPPLPPLLAGPSRLPPPSPSSATSSPRKRASERSSQSVRPRGPPPGVAFTTALAPMASLPPQPENTMQKSAAALAADDAARAAAVAWAEAHARARRAAALVAAAVPVPVGCSSLKTVASAPCEIGGSGRRGGGLASFASSLVARGGGSLNGVGKAPRVAKRVGVSAAKQQRAAAAVAAAAQASLYYGYGELSASQHDVLLRSKINGGGESGRGLLAAGCSTDGGARGGSSHHLHLHQRPRHHEHVLVGARVAVHSPRDGAFFRATVRDVSSAAGAATGRGLPPGAALLVYDDGKAEVAHLGSRRFRLLTPRASAGCGAGLLAAASAVGAEGLRLDADCAPPPAGAGLPAGPESARRGAALLLRSPAAAACGGTEGVVIDSSSAPLEFGNYLSSSSPPALDNSANSAWCRADVVGVDRAARHVRVLYADGEDEWIDLAAEAASGAARVAPLGSFWPPLALGLAPGRCRPEGAAAVGWRVALYCFREASFFAADVESFDCQTGLHRLAYVDGSGIVEDARLDAEAVKWVSPPNASMAVTVATPFARAANNITNLGSSSPCPPPHPRSPAPNASALASPPSPDACRAGSSSFSADGNGNENDAATATTNGRGSNTNLVGYGSMGSVSCDAAAAAVAALTASRTDAVAVAAAAAAAAAANGSWDPMDAEEDPWAGGDGNEASAPVAAAAAAEAAWWKGDASAAAGVARLTLGISNVAAAGNACLLPSAEKNDEDGDSKDSAVSCDNAGAGRGGSTSPLTPTNAAAAAAAAAASVAATAAVASPLSVPASRIAPDFGTGGHDGSSSEDGSVHGSVAPLASLLPNSHAFSGSGNNGGGGCGGGSGDSKDSDSAAAAFRNFYGGACGALVSCGGTSTAAVAALAYDTFLGGDFCGDGNGAAGGAGGDLDLPTTLNWLFPKERKKN